VSETKPPPFPKFEWSEDDEAWIIRHGDITITFFNEGELIVSGHDVTAQVTYDQITEERGLRFQDYKRREYDRSISLRRVK